MIADEATGDDCDVLVVGAGISGLTAAFRLAHKGFRVEVIDAASQPGGVIGTGRHDGVLYEHGPNSILETSPLVPGLLADLGIAGERIEVNSAASKRYVVRDGALTALPVSPAALLTTRLFSAGAKLALLREPFVARAKKDSEESVSEFVTRRLGREILDYAIEPFVAGIYAGNPDELSLPAAFPRLAALESRYGSLIKGQIMERGQRHTAKSFSFVTGMRTLTEALASAVRVRTREHATDIAPTTDGAIVVGIDSERGPSQIRARAVILAVPADGAASLVRDLARDAALALREIPYAPVASIASVYARADVAHALDGFGFLVPRVEKRRILGTLFSSSMFEGRAPKGQVLLTTYVGGRRDPELALSPEDELQAMVADELATLLGASQGPRLSVATRWPRAIPQYTLGHRQRIQRAERVESMLPGLYLCASYRGGVSVGDCIKSAHQTADTAAEYLGNRIQSRA